MANKSNIDIEEYTFKSFSPTHDEEAGEVKDYSFQSLEGRSNKDLENKVKQTEFFRKKAKTNAFKISPVVLKYRGIDEQETVEREKRIVEEVEKRVAKIREKAIEQGRQEGVDLGRQEVYEQTRFAAEEKISKLSEMVSEVLYTKEEIFLSEKKQIYDLVRTLTKWIILRELKDDGQYVARLLEKLVIEMQSKKNLLIQVDQKMFEQMPEVLEIVQKKLGEIQNVRIEIDYDIQGPGIIIESENGIINGTLGEQLNGLDKLFKAVGLDPHDNEDRNNDG